MVLVDEDCAGSSHIEAVKKIRNFAAGQPGVLLACTTNRDNEALLDLSEAGADDFLVFPLDDDQLGLRLEIALRNARRIESLSDGAIRSSTDKITGLLDRSEFLNAIQRKRMSDDSGAILLVKIERLKEINEELGYRAGDQLLVETARFLERYRQPDDVLGRTGGDQFALLATGVRNEDEARQLATRIIDDFRARTWVLGGQETMVTPRVGVAFGTTSKTDSDRLLRDAEIAITQVRGKGHQGYSVFVPSMERQQNERRQIEAELQRALLHGEFRVYFQPEVHLDSGEIIGAEALLRWQHPESGLLLPGEFIAVAEETGLIEPIGAWILEQACREVAGWRATQGVGDEFIIGVNLASDQHRKGDLVDHVRQVLRQVLQRSGLPARSLRVEVTETACFDDDPEFIRVLEALRGLGVHIAFDDFGTGYASLSNLRGIPVDTLKIDRSFVSGGPSATGRLSITESVAWLAHRSGLDVVVEGIETSAQLARVRAFDCVRGQGFYFSRAINADSMRFLLATGPKTFAHLVDGIATPRRTSSLDRSALSYGDG